MSGAVAGVVGVLALVMGARELQRFDLEVVRPVSRQLFVEEGPAARAVNAQAIAEVLVRRSKRATKAAGRKVTVEDLQTGRYLDTYTGPVTAWEGFTDALERGEGARVGDKGFRERAMAAAVRGYLAVHLSGLVSPVAPGALWYRHARPGELPGTWRGSVLVRELDGPNGRVLGLYAPKA
jgi:hypothetical protein